MNRLRARLALLASVALVATAVATSALALGTASRAPGAATRTPADITNPDVTSVDPASALNDIDSPVTIHGSGFAVSTDDSGNIVAEPTVTLGTATSVVATLTGVSLVDSDTLSASVPWGTAPGLYSLTVTNPDGGTSTFPNAFTVRLGLGQWNAGALYGGEIDQILMRPGDSDTLYALAYGVIGLFRSDDAGGSWRFVTDQAWANNNRFVVDPFPGHEDWIYCYAPNGIMRSMDEGVTWTDIMQSWPFDSTGATATPGVQVVAPQVYVSPDTSGTLFASSSSGYGTSDSGVPFGLIESTDGGDTWHEVAGMAGVPVQDLAFDPADPQHVALATSDAHVYTSSDGGGTWTPAASPPGMSHLWLRGSITYDPYRSGEIWLSCYGPQGDAGLFKSTDASATGWTNVSVPGAGGVASISFASADSVYVPGYHSVNGGSSWSPWGPTPWYGYGAVLVDRDDTQTIYIANDECGVEKTTDGGQTWQVDNDGLAGLQTNSVSVSHADPLRVYATANGPLGIFRTADGGDDWQYLQISGSSNVRQVLEDPQDPARVYVGADTGFYVSTDEGDTWDSTGDWSTLLGVSQPGLFVDMAADPDPAHHGRLLASFGGGMYGIGAGTLYKTDDYGASWQPVTLPVPDRSTDASASMRWITSIQFDPAATGTVYLTTKGTGVYRSTDHGDDWSRVDPADQPDMASAQDVAIATHPQHVVLVGGTATSQAYRSVDGGDTWVRCLSNTSPATYLFAGGDSTRLYAGTLGLYYSSDLGDTWEQAGGPLGTMQVMALDSGETNDGRAIVYAATPGGSAPAESGAAFSRLRIAAAGGGTLFDAGIYRDAQADTALSVSAHTTTPAYLTGTTFSGLLESLGEALPGQSVQLQSSTDARRFKAIATATTRSSGAFSFGAQKPTSKTYYRVAFGQTSRYFGITSAVVTVVPQVSLSTVYAPAAASHTRAFTAYGFLKPRHTAGSHPVWIYTYRYVRGRWVGYGYVLARAYTYSATETKYSVSLRLASAGRWRLRAFAPADAGHSATWSSGYRYVTVR